MPATPTQESDAPDQVLVARAQRGDGTALVALYRRYVGEVYGFSLNQLGSTQDAEDVTSETFVRVVDALDGFRGQSSFRTWLYAIARNQVRDHYRRNGRHPPTDSGLDQVAAISQAPEPARRATSRWSRQGAAVLAALPSNYRDVLRLRILEGRSVRETAAAMGTTEGNVKVLQHRALKRATAIAGQLEAEQLEAEDEDDC